ncbi:hypothetical protein GCM10007422_21530 [Pedobacter zeae]|uniref:Peptidase MA superfamily protein n=1 Tax=Pedobacter zeae TaxID=1737356 RepID=A0ABQ1XWZ8_9SPHI|nr:hypothetical protein GCM10007422_21530 [Pedobacter zeae]
MFSRRLIFGLFLITLSYSANAQKAYINPGVDTTDVRIKEVIQFYQNYLGDFKGKKLPDFNKYWSAEDCKNFKIPDPSVYGIGGDYPTVSMATVKTIFYVKPLSDSLFILKTTGGWIDSLKNYNLLYNSNHYVKKTKSKHLEFITPYQYSIDQWASKKVRNVTFFYPKKIKFNSTRADELINQLKKLEKDWSTSPIEIKYFYTSTYDEIQFIRGFDFTLGLGNADKPTGISNQTDNIVYCAGSGENYFHEVVHIYLNPMHKHSPLNEGLAVFYGGSMGHPLKWHIKRLQDYLMNHKTIDLGKLDNFYFMDNYTNPNSTILGMFCQLAYDRDKINGLKRIMTYTSIKEILDKEFNISPEDQNKALRKLIYNYKAID